MIILDTTVISEVMRPEPNRSVIAWLDAQEIKTLFLTSITISELLFGVESMPAGKRKSRLNIYTTGLNDIFADRILSFDLLAAQHYAGLAVAAQKRGHGFPVPDGYIAAIAASHKYAIATRDSAPFASVGLTVIDPWRMTNEHRSRHNA